MKTKICVACAQEKPAMAFSQSPNSSAPDKLSIYCVACGSTLSDKEKARLHLAHWRKNRAQKVPAQSGAPIDASDYEHRLRAQCGVCAICAQAPKPKRKTALVVDRHRDGAVRGLLCDSCDQGLSGFGGDAGRLKAALRYLGNTDEP